VEAVEFHRDLIRDNNRLPQSLKNGAFAGKVRPYTMHAIKPA
jgi:hypothetical protein